MKKKEILAEFYKSLSENKATGSCLKKNHRGSTNEPKTDVVFEQFNQKQEIIIKKEYTLKELLSYQFDEFIINSYRAVFHRNPTGPEQKNALENYNEHTLAKIYRIGRMRYCQDGRKFQTRIKLLLPAFVLSIGYRIPVISYFIKFLSYLLTFPGDIMILKRELYQQKALNQIEKEFLWSRYQESLARISQKTYPSERVKIICKNNDKKKFSQPRPIDKLQKKKIIICCMSLKENDAIGNDIIFQYHTLKQYHDVWLYSEFVDPVYRPKISSYQEFVHIIKDQQAILIFHFSSYWKRMDEIFIHLQCKFILRYHNITPPSFFKSHSQKIQQQTRKTVQQFRSLLKQRKIDSIWANSSFTAESINDLAISEKEIYIVPPVVPLIPYSDAIDTSEIIHFLFVGRMAPNKGHIHLIRSLATYRNKYHENFQLHLVGATSPDLQNYKQSIKQQLIENGLWHHTSIYENLTEQQLIDIYKKSDYLLMLSEHEGFCVPIIEAQSSGLPIIAVASSAIADTLGENQICLASYDYEKIAIAIDLLQQPHYKNFFIKSGQKNAQQYHPQNQKDWLLRIIEAV